MLRVYVPAGDTSPFNIKKGSAIISTGDVQNGMLLVYFEGNVNNAVNLHRYEDQLLCAAGRLVMKYPTVARSMMEVDSLIEVGTYDYENHTFHAYPNRLEELNCWLDEPRYVHSIVLNGCTISITSRYSPEERTQILNCIRNSLHGDLVNTVDGVVYVVTLDKENKLVRCPLLTLEDHQLDFCH